MAVDLGDSSDSGFDVGERPHWRGLDVTLTPQQELACALRIIARAGCNLDVAGHITWVADADGSMWTNPWGMWWEEVKASDVILVDKNGQQIDGRWPPNPAVYIHTEVHRRRGKRGAVAVHNHPHFGVLLGTMEVVPAITDQQACIFADELTLWNEYTGGVETLDEGVAFADAIGDKSVVLLKNHGCLVTGPTIMQATYKAVTFERTCRLNYEAIAAGVKPTTVPENIQKQIKNSVLRYAAPVYWEGAVRQLLDREPEVLE